MRMPILLYMMTNSPVYVVGDELVALGSCPYHLKTFLAGEDQWLVR